MHSRQDSRLARWLPVVLIALLVAVPAAAQEIDEDEDEDARPPVEELEVESESEPAEAPSWIDLSDEDAELEQDWTEGRVDRTGRPVDSGDRMSQESAAIEIAVLDYIAGAGMHETQAAYAGRGADGNLARGEPHVEVLHVRGPTAMAQVDTLLGPEIYHLVQEEDGWRVIHLSWHGENSN